ncbi:DUF6781 family protein [Nitrosomonas halophila]|uniref:Uncharacterized protein n=1 Tax=Nitrosomonas halophila TaxID=44576 RepID=A0A1H3MVF6_9PROT|nr:DUF6781 family protein [Nitrosomonas halophila]SDY80566.1 hypothetical protein SAMN05421881_10658 [Nitrosomonas halophila]
MQNDNPGATHANDDIAQLTAEIREAVAHGGDIEKTVRNLTLKAMHANGLDPESLVRIAAAVMEGAHEGAQHELSHASEQSQAAQTQIIQAVAGLDAAFAQLAGASKLALEEAASKAKQFSHSELAKTRADLESLESLFMDTLKQAATAAQGLIAETLQDLYQHAERNGTAVGAQLKDTLAVFAHQMASTGRAQLEAGAQLTQITADLLHKIASGVLTGIVDQVKQADKNK